MLPLKTNLECAIKALFLGLFILMSTIASAQLSVKPNRATTRYELGETANFLVTGAKNGTLNYEIKHTIIDTLQLLGSGTVPVVNGEANITFTAMEAGFVVCKVQQDTSKHYAGATFSPEKLQALENEPADFDAFWAAEKAAVQALPIDVNLTYIRTGGYSNIFSFSIGILDGRRAYGYMAVPVGTVSSYPAIFLMPSFGAVANLVTDDPSVAERAGAITIFLSPHNNPPNVSSNLPDYLVDGLESPSTYYIKYALLGAVKMIDYLKTRTDFNGQVGTLGISQGGGLAALFAGIDNRVSLLACAYPSFSNQIAAKYSKPTAFPFFYHTAHSPTLSRETIMSTIKYYDPVYALRRFKGVSWSATSLKDDVCPPQATTTGFNQIKGQHISEILLDKLHVQGPDDFFNSELNNSVYAFFRRHFPNARRAPWPYNPPTLGYLVEAGKDTTLLAMSLPLTGFVGVNDIALPNLPVYWKKIEGAGTVTFSNPTSRNTNVTFSEVGVYRLRFSAEDFSTLSDRKYFILSDDIVVNVGGIVPIELTEFNGTIKDKTNELTWTTASEINNKGFDIERSDDGKRWQRLDFVKGKGNSNQLSTYNFTDADPLSISYYRLRQMDLSGNFSYSKIISLTRKENKEVLIFPNPATNVLTIQMENKTNSSFRIYDILGRTILIDNTTTNETRLNISRLARGSYFIQILNGQITTTQKFIKN